MRIIAFLLTSATITLLLPQSSSSYRVTHNYALGGDGSWDYIVPDPPNHRLFIARQNRVMVVDEDINAIKSLSDVLHAKGYHVVESDGKDLVANAIANQPDIIILNSVLSDNHEIVQSLRFEKGLENVLFLIYQ